jgi:hypothetical protein
LNDIAGGDGQGFNPRLPKREKSIKHPFLANLGCEKIKGVLSPNEKANTYGKGLVILKPCFYLKSIDLPKPLGSQRLWQVKEATKRHMLTEELSALFSQKRRHNLLKKRTKSIC